MSNTDVLIAGGGLVGASLAAALGDAGLDVTVVEAVPANTAAPGSFDQRHTALTPGSQCFFETLGLWPAMAPRATPMTEIRVSDRGRFGFMRMTAADEGLPALGWVVPNHVIGAALQQALSGAPVVTVRQPARLTTVTTDDDGVSALIEDDEGEQFVRARLLVVAEGAGSPTREALGIAHSERGYGQGAIVAKVRSERAHRGRAWERFTADGPLAVLPAEDGVAVVWALPSERAEAMRTASDGAFLAALQEQFGHRLGRLTAVGERSVYELSALAADRVVGRSSVVMGNAAHTLHPVAGQGLNLSLRDVATLAEYLVDAPVEDLNSATLLQAYARARRADYRAVFAFTDVLVRGFSNALPGVSWLRDATITGLDRVPPARRALMKRAMGRHGWTPRLMHGQALGSAASD